MREILFRGKRDDDGEWMFGNLTLWGDGTASINETPAEGSPLYAVDPDSIGQYTGLTDKNGKKIFEGDIVKAKFKSNHSMHAFKVVFHAGMFLFENRCVRVTSFDVFGVKIIGNIHDTPELLKGGGEE